MIERTSPTDVATTAEIAVGHDADELPAIRRILDAVATVVDERPALAVRHEVVRRFARAALRRVPTDLLRVARPDLVADRLVEAFEVVDARREDELAIEIFTPELALDGSGEPGSIVQVASEDRAFLLGTVTEELALRGLTPMRALHPIVGVERDPDGTITQIVPARTATRRESLLHIELASQVAPAAADELAARLRRLLRDVMAATGDFGDMRARLREVIEEIRATDPSHADPEQIDETAALFEWLLEDNFIILGCRDYELVDLPADHPQGPGPAGCVTRGSGLGILRDEDASSLSEPVALDQMDDDLRARILSRELLVVSRTNRLSTVQRRTRLEYFGLTRYGPDGSVRGEFRLLGLFSRKGQAQTARTTPVLRRKLRHILEREDVVPGSHDEGTLINLFQAVPKDELFQADVDTLHKTLVGLLHAEEHGDTRVLLRTDQFTHTVSILVAVPRDRYSPQLREQLQRLFLERFHGSEVEVELSLGDRREALARFSVIVAGDIPAVDPAELQRVVRTLARSWTDDLASLLARRHGEVEGRRLLREIGEHLPGSYRARVPVPVGGDDVVRIDELLRASDDLAVRLQDPVEDGGAVRLKAYKRGESLELSGFLPILESLGLTVSEELPYHVDLGPDRPAVHVHDFGVRDSRAARPGSGPPIDVDAVGDRLAAATLAAWRRQADVDSLNRLVLRADMEWRDVAILRAYRRYRRQVGTAYTPEYVNDALADNPDVARALLALFDATFDPDGDRDPDTLARLRDDVEAACDEVTRLDHDRIMRGFLALVDATLRTNAFRPDAIVETPDGVTVPYLAFKLDTEAVPDAPKPVPYREIFVYSPQVEGIHLRGGPVARGGLRWSDRQDDVRTEILGLVKAQNLKNAVIVPTGAKGGFVVKEDVPASELRAAVERQYVTFIRGLLDLTDDITAGTVVPPPRVVRRDDDDPYLVVAADKGTATFSDTANRVAEEYGFWLGDAFASGGSRGYDHKALGITARGAWVAVRRHFRELDTDTQTEPVRVVGIGDMSGDVFGNGMLSSRTLRLVAAFDHRDVFVDPDPDPEVSYRERERLFGLAGSSWRDYDRGRLSPGGGVFSRSAKRIELSDEIRELLRIDEETLAPAQLIQAILRAPVDLLFAGGIGTYVKASTETHAEIGDRTNEELRVDANELRARVFAEGANLAITQAGRIQYARRGGRINQDAIDNAAGVDISDHEVNVKILLRAAEEAGLIDRAERDQLLVEVTDDVVAHVLRDVDLQTWQLSQAVGHSARRMDAYERLMRRLEATGLLDRRVEELPSRKQMAERIDAGAGLSRPELATLLAYSKRVLTDAILDSDLPDAPVLQPLLATYFPSLLAERFGDLLAHHRLRRDLLATLVANEIVNRIGITFAFRLSSETGTQLVDVARAYWAARTIVDADRHWRSVEELLDVVGPERQLQLKSEVDVLVQQLTGTYLHDERAQDLDAIIDRDRGAFATLAARWMQVGTPDQQRARRQRAQQLAEDLVAPDLADFLACARELGMAPDVVAVAHELPAVGSPRPPVEVADAFLRLGDALALDRLERVLRPVEPTARWARWQHAGLVDDLRTLRREAAWAALRAAPDRSEADAVEAFLRRVSTRLAHAATLVREVEQAEEVDLDAVAVAVRALRRVVT